MRRRIHRPQRIINLLGTLEQVPSRTSDERCGSRSLGNLGCEDGASDGLLEDHSWRW
jgi:hypothetical protein